MYLPYHGFDVSSYDFSTNVSVLSLVLIQSFIIRFLYNSLHQEVFPILLCITVMSYHAAELRIKTSVQRCVHRQRRFYLLHSVHSVVFWGSRHW